MFGRPVEGWGTGAAVVAPSMLRSKGTARWRGKRGNAALGRMPKQSLSRERQNVLLQRKNCVAECFQTFNFIMIHIYIYIRVCNLHITKFPQNNG